MVTPSLNFLVSLHCFPFPKPIWHSQGDFFLTAPAHMPLILLYPSPFAPILYKLCITGLSKQGCQESLEPSHCASVLNLNESFIRISSNGGLTPKIPRSKILYFYFLNIFSKSQSNFSSVNIHKKIGLMWTVEMIISFPNMIQLKSKNFLQHSAL